MLTRREGEERLLKRSRDFLKGSLEEYLLELGVLEDAYITSRYVPRDFTKQEAEGLMKAVREIMENVP
ncbi:HEPN domain-containing protein [Candidatus Bathyarchaeota archaeon]|nr:HEPN domain-containing protein [Candidatus Bathyarchaeota archaeon]